MHIENLIETHDACETDLFQCSDFYVPDTDKQLDRLCDVALAFMRSFYTVGFYRDEDGDWIRNDGDELEIYNHDSFVIVTADYFADCSPRERYETLDDMLLDYEGEEPPKLPLICEIGLDGEIGVPSEVVEHFNKWHCYRPIKMPSKYVYEDADGLHKADYRDTKEESNG